MSLLQSTRLVLAPPHRAGFPFLAGGLVAMLLGLLLWNPLAWLGALLPPAASAHEMTMAEMEVREITPGEFMWMWAATNEKLPDSNVIRPVWPEQCVAEDSALHCGKEGLRGPLSIDGVGTTYSAALVKIFWLDGQSRVYTISKGTPRVYLLGAADDTRSITEIASTYTVLGIEHIFTGLDHILFVISLLCLVGFTRRLVWTISAFTLAHMLTLTVCGALIAPVPSTMRKCPGNFSVTSILPSGRNASAQGRCSLSVRVVTLYAAAL